MKIILHRRQIFLVSRENYWFAIEYQGMSQIKSDVYQYLLQHK